MTSDIQERLRRIRGTQFTPYENELVGEAADTIDSLLKRIEVLEGFERTAVDVLDVADNIIAVNCGTDTPKEWDKAFAKFAKTRAALSDGIVKG